MQDEKFIQSGTIIAKRYEILKCLGAGSMGMVYSCRDCELAGRRIAMKVLFPEVAHDTIATKRFMNEVNAAYIVSHPNVVRAYEFFRDGDLVAYTMEFVDGGDLASRLAENKLIPINESLNILSQMCLGVQAIHDAQIIHRDLKPENIMLTHDGVVKIADFGIARLHNGPKLTEHGGVVGTIDYVSPEYMLNSQVDWRSDIYAIGILAYEMIAGCPPFRGDSVYATMTKRLKTDPEPLTKFRPECPKKLANIVIKAMAREPDKRFQSAYEMYEALNQLGGFELPYSHHAHVLHENGHESSLSVSSNSPEKQIRPNSQTDKDENVEHQFPVTQELSEYAEELRRHGEMVLEKEKLRSEENAKYATVAQKIPAKVLEALSFENIDIASQYYDEKNAEEDNSLASNDYVLGSLSQKQNYEYSTDVMKKVDFSKSKKLYKLALKVLVAVVIILIGITIAYGCYTYVFAD